MKPINTIGIVGLGLMGGSLALALKKRLPQYTIVGISRNQETLRVALEKKVIDQAASDLTNVLQERDLDVIVLATPVLIIERMIGVVGRYAKNCPIVTDLGSTKASLVACAEKAGSHAMHFVGSHPMTGSHNAGFTFADETLYDGSLCFLTRTDKTNGEAFAQVENMWHALGVKTFCVDPEEHDQIVSRISHLPHAVAFALVDAVSKKGDACFQFAGGGFRDFTRIAASDPTMWSDIFQANKKNVLSDLRSFRDAIDAFIAKVENDDAEKLRHFLEQVSEKRRNLL